MATYVSNFGLYTWRYDVISPSIFWLCLRSAFRLQTSSAAARILSAGAANRAEADQIQRCRVCRRVGEMNGRSPTIRFLQASGEKLVTGVTGDHSPTNHVNCPICPIWNGNLRGFSSAKFGSFTVQRFRMVWRTWQWPFQEPKLEVTTIYQAYFSGLCRGISLQHMALYGTVPLL